MKPKAHPSGSVRSQRRIVLAVGSVLVAVVVLTVTISFIRRPTSPVPPQIDDQGIDPAVAVAISKARDKIINDPTSDVAWGRLGMVLLAHDYGEQSIVCLEQAEARNTLQPDWPYFQGVALSAERPEDALPKFLRAIELTEKTSELPQLRAIDQLLKLDRYDEAEQLAAEIVGRQPGHAWAELHLGRIALSRAQPQESLDHLAIAVTSNYTRKSALGLLAQVRQMLGESAAAAQLQQEAAIAPDDVPWPDPFYTRLMKLRTGRSASIARARELFLANQLQPGIALVEQTIQRYPKEPYLWFMLGKARYQTKEINLAEQALRKSYELEPKSVQTVFLLGVVLGEKGDLHGAKRFFRASTELSAGFAMGSYNFGLCLLKEGDRKGAIEAFREAAQADSEFAKAHQGLAELLAEEGQIEDALVHAQQAVRLRPDDTEAQKILDGVQRARVRTGDQ